MLNGCHLGFCNRVPVTWCYVDGWTYLGVGLESQIVDTANFAFSVLPTLPRNKVQDSGAGSSALTYATDSADKEKATSEEDSVHAGKWTEFLMGFVRPQKPIQLGGWTEAPPSLGCEEILGGL